MKVIQRRAGCNACIAALCIAVALNVGSIAAAGAAAAVRHEPAKNLDVPPGAAGIGDEARDALPPLSMRLLRDTDTAANGLGSSPRRFFAHAGRVWFSATTPATGTELFVTDGTLAGTRLAADIARGPASSDPKVVGVAGTRLIVAADDGVVGRQLWSVPFAAGAPQRLTSTSAGEYEFTAVATLADRLVYRTAARPSLHATDGTAAGTGTLGEPFGAIDTSLPGLSCQVGGAALFDVRPSGNAGFGEASLVRTDGTAAGTVALSGVGTTYLSSAVFH
ncbi:MAG TPA: hypothetical protein VM555_00955, partial [Tahibacter sp.]|nr:hypothetical protein [Tahibacter sp.]